MGGHLMAGKFGSVVGGCIGLLFFGPMGALIGSKIGGATWFISSVTRED